MDITIKRNRKSTRAGSKFSLPNFSVLTGLNGSGKSHLLEALASREDSSIIENGKLITKVHYIPFNGLNPKIAEVCDPAQLLSESKDIWRQIKNAQLKMHDREQKHGQAAAIGTSKLPNPLKERVSALMERSKKGFYDLTEDDVLNEISTKNDANGNLFIAQLAKIIKVYHTRKDKNEYNEYKSKKSGDVGIKFLSNEKFKELYGPPPWELINAVLAKAGLPYKVQSPESQDPDATYTLRLYDEGTKADISVDDLSTGEKVLMSMALAIYNAKENGEKPELLLLDEPDAPLHPEFSRLLVETLSETIVRDAGVRVIMTTHSPSTAAICPSGSLFEINKATRTPRMCSASEALSVLTAGIPHLFVRVENRRQIFVESKNDVQYYHRLFYILGRNGRFNYEPVFLEPHSGTSNCTDAITIATALTKSGGDIVRALVDFDGSNVEKHPVYVLGSSSRYSIENYILDPVFIALALIREEKKSLADFGISRAVSYIETASLTQAELQSIVNIVESAVSLVDANRVTSKLENGFELSFSSKLLMEPGHKYEAALLSVYPELGAVKRGTGDFALKNGVLRVIEDHAKFLPIEIGETFLKLG